MQKSISCQEFNERLSIGKAGELEGCSQCAWKQLHECGKVFSVEDLSEMFPAYVSICSTVPVVVVKFPSYAVDVIGYSVDNLTINEIQEILQKNGIDEKTDFYQICENNVGFFWNNNREISRYSNMRILCQNFELDRNEILREKIKKVLEKEGYRFEVTASINYIYCRIKFVDDEHNRFVIDEG